MMRWHQFISVQHIFIKWECHGKFMVWEIFWGLNSIAPAGFFYYVLYSQDMIALNPILHHIHSTTTHQLLQALSNHSSFIMMSIFLRYLNGTCFVLIRMSHGLCSGKQDCMLYVLVMFAECKFTLFRSFFLSLSVFSLVEIPGPFCSVFVLGPLARLSSILCSQKSQSCLEINLSHDSIHNRFLLQFNLLFELHFYQL